MERGEGGGGGGFGGGNPFAGFGFGGPGGGEGIRWEFGGGGGGGAGQQVDMEDIMEQFFGGGGGGGRGRAVSQCQGLWLLGRQSSQHTCLPLLIVQNFAAAAFSTQSRCRPPCSRPASAESGPCAHRSRCVIASATAGKYTAGLAQCHALRHALRVLSGLVGLMQLLCLLLTDEIE